MILAPFLYSNQSDAYDRAVGELRDVYGNTDDIVQEWVDKLLVEPDSLREYTLSLQTCCAVVTAVGKTQESVNRYDLGKIAKHMPQECYSRWRTEALPVTDEEHRLVGLADLARHVSKYYREICQPIHGGYIESQHLSVRQDVHATMPTTTPTTMPTTTNNYVEPCEACERQEHLLDDCTKFKALSLVIKRRIVIVHRLCFNCLQPGHNAIDCPDDKRCQSDGCGRRHATLLHDPHWKGAPNSRTVSQPMNTEQE
jgi:hypothetical protein